jgi:large subunit ribosomal protein L25
MTEKNSAPVLSATPRDLLGKKVRQLRRTGLVPAVIYGHNKQTIPLSIRAKEFDMVYSTSGSSTLISLEIEDKKQIKVLIHGVQLNPVKGSVLHVDFYQVNLKEKIRTTIPLHLVGESEAVEVEGGNLLSVKDEIEVECLPEDLIQHIDVDISALKGFDDIIRVEDLQIPAGITVLDDPEDTLVSVNAPRSEDELAELESTPVAELENIEIDTKSGTDTVVEEPEEKK